MNLFSTYATSTDATSVPVINGVLFSLLQDLRKKLFLDQETPLTLSFRHGFSSSETLLDLSNVFPFGFYQIVFRNTILL